MVVRYRPFLVLSIGSTIRKVPLARLAGYTVKWTGLVNTGRLVTNALPNQDSVIQDALVRPKSPKNKESGR